MNVRELREMLQALEAEGKGELEVKTSYNYGDYWKTTVAQDVSNCDEAEVKYSDYHQMDKVVDTDRDDCDEDTTTVIILN